MCWKGDSFFFNSIKNELRQYVDLPTILENIQIRILLTILLKNCLSTSLKTVYYIENVDVFENIQNTAGWDNIIHLKACFSSIYRKAFLISLKTLILKAKPFPILSHLEIRSCFFLSKDW